MISFFNRLPLLTESCFSQVSWRESHLLTSVILHGVNPADLLSSVNLRSVNPTIVILFAEFSTDLSFKEKTLPLFT